MAFNRPLNKENLLAFVLPEGEHTVKIVAAEEAISKTSGRDMIKLTLQVLLNVQFASQKITYFIVDDEKADDKVVKLFKACGKQPPAMITPSIFVGLVGKVKTKNTEFNGEVRPEIHYWVRPPADVELKPWNPEAGNNTQENPLNSADNIPF